jgi:hypothetical protein
MPFKLNLQGINVEFFLHDASGRRNHRRRHYYAHPARAKITPQLVVAGGEKVKSMAAWCTARNPQKNCGGRSVTVASFGRGQAKSHMLHVGEY